MPDFSYEDSHEGRACGIDEAGRGPLAGPVVAACVFIPPDRRGLAFVPLIRDSKRLSKSQLLSLHEKICTHFEVGVAECSPHEIDDLNILWASMLAMERAFADMSFRRKPGPDNHGDPWQPNPGLRRDDMLCLIDGNRIPRDLPAPARAIVKGDSRSVSIAAASIVAKVTRDRIMADLATRHPHYGWDRNAGYPTREHLEALAKHGVTDHHRRTFGPVRAMLQPSASFPRARTQ